MRSGGLSAPSVRGIGPTIAMLVPIWEQHTAGPDPEPFLVLSLAALGGLAGGLLVQLAMPGVGLPGTALGAVVAGRLLIVGARALSRRRAVS